MKQSVTTIAMALGLLAAGLPVGLPLAFSESGKCWVQQFIPGGRNDTRQCEWYGGSNPRCTGTCYWFEKVGNEDTRDCRVCTSTARFWAECTQQDTGRRIRVQRKDGQCVLADRYSCTCGEFGDPYESFVKCYTASGTPCQTQSGDWD